MRKLKELRRRKKNRVNVYDLIRKNENQRFVMGV